MSVHQSEWLRPVATRPDRERTFRLLSVAAVVLLVVYLAATLAGMPRATSSLIFSVVVFPVPFLAWWAYALSPRELRSMWLLGAWAATS